MNSNEFSKVKHTLRDLCDSILDDKQPEYTERNRDILYNFKTTALELGLTPQQILFVHMRKHLSSITQFCAGKYVGKESIYGRIADTVNYLTLLYAITAEQEPEIE